MKRVVLSIVTALTIGGSAAVFAQIPVTDIAQNTQTALNQAANIVQYIEQVAQLKMQVEQQAQQYKALTGSRDMGNILNDPKYRQYLPADWQDVYDKVKQGGYAGLSGSARSIYDKNHIYDACEAIEDPDRQSSCNSLAMKPSIDQGTAEDAYKMAEERLDQIDQLSKQINTTQDPKAIAELQGRIATEQAAIQNEQTKLELYKMVAEAQDRVQEQRENEMNAQIWAGRNSPQVKPLTFGGN